MINKIKTFDLTGNKKMFHKQQYNTKFFLNVEYVVCVLCVNFHYKYQIVFLFKSIFYISFDEWVANGVDITSCNKYLSTIFLKFFCERAFANLFSYIKIYCDSMKILFNIIIIIIFRRKNIAPLLIEILCNFLTTA